MQDRIAALLYVVVLATATLLYTDTENVELLKHPLNAIAALWDQATSPDMDLD